MHACHTCFWSLESNQLMLDSGGMLLWYVEFWNVFLSTDANLQPLAQSKKWKWINHHGIKLMLCILFKTNQVCHGHEPTIRKIVVPEGGAYSGFHVQDGTQLERVVSLTNRLRSRQISLAQSTTYIIRQQDDSFTINGPRKVCPTR